MGFAGSGFGIPNRGIREKGVKDVPDAVVDTRLAQRFSTSYEPIRRGTNSASAPGMSEITSYRDLVCWQKAIELALLVYEVTGKYPADERLR